MTTLRNWGYLWFFTALYVLAHILHYIFGWYDFVAEQADHGTVATHADYLLHFLNVTMENWQSEFLQILLGTGMSIWLSVKGNDTDRIEKKVDQIRECLGIDKRPLG